MLIELNLQTEPCIPCYLNHYKIYCNAAFTAEVYCAIISEAYNELQLKYESLKMTKRIAMILYASLTSLSIDISFSINFS